jgi:serine/threonine protein kinase
VSSYLDTHLNILVAVKTFRQRVSVEDRNREAEQALLWRALPHRNLVRLLGVVKNGTCPLSIIFHYARESLADRFDAYCGLLPLREIGASVEQLAAALNHMHEHGVIHRDVKLANILLRSSVLAPMRVLLCDYGLARLIHVADTPRRQTQPYRAPEMELGRSPTMAVDTCAKMLMVACPKAVAHSHCLNQSHDADHRRCLEILAFGGVARHFGTLELGRRLGCLKDAQAAGPLEELSKSGWSTVP